MLGTLPGTLSQQDLGLGAGSSDWDESGFRVTRGETHPGLRVTRGGLGHLKFRVARGELQPGCRVTKGELGAWNLAWGFEQG